MGFPQIIYVKQEIAYDKEILWVCDEEKTPLASQDGEILIATYKLLEVQAVSLRLVSRIPPKKLDNETLKE
jgi:hypothetical protein